MRLLSIASLAAVAVYLIALMTAFAARYLYRREVNPSVWMTLAGIFPMISLALYFLLGVGDARVLRLITFAVTASHWLLVLLALFVIPVNRKPSSATAWIMLIAIAPFLGLIIFLLIGSPKLPHQRRFRQRQMDRMVQHAVEATAVHPELAPLYGPTVAERYRGFAELGHTLGGMPAFAGNRVEPIEDYPAIFRRLADDIDAARSFVHVQFYIISRDEETEVVFQALERARDRGVQVRVLLDDVGSNRYPSSKATDQWLRRSGFGYHRLLPFKLFDGQWIRPDLRNHRKIVVIDGVIGYTGSMNLIRRNYFRKDSMYYDELVVRVEGPIVAQLSAVITTDWFGETGKILGVDEAHETLVRPHRAGASLCQVLPSGSGHDDENNLKLFTALIHGARRKLTIVNPYFVPDDALMVAICSAAQAGVDVTMINSEAPDQFMVYHAQRSFYDELLRCGVKIRLYEAPILLHSKFMTVDDDIAMVGSSNFDMRSFQLNLEVSMFCYDPAVVGALREVEKLYFARSKPLTREQWRARPRHVRLFENVTRLTAALQ